MSLSFHTVSVSLDFGFFWPAIVFFLSIFLSYLCYPIIIRVSKAKRLMAKPNHRSVHRFKTPNLGGIGIFLAINLIITLLGNYFEDSTLLSLLGSITILFFTGLIDDLVGVKPKSKLLLQVIAATAVILISDLRITDLQGLMGIGELSYVVSTLLTIFFFVLLINAYNLIDGVDGLAGMFAITVTVFFGFFYYVNGNNSMFFLSICIVGSLISFLIFNFSKKEKVFMGDTGSLVIGFLLAYQAVNFLTVDFNPNFLIQNTKSPVFILALFSFPILDTSRVFLLRIMKKKSPFSADKSHIHHVFLNYGLKHWQISVLSTFFTSTLVLIVFLFNDLTINKQTTFLLAMWGLTVLVVNNYSLISKLKNISNQDVTEGADSEGAQVHKGKTIALRDLA
ncbi:undecaprenyl/decaprenyl-phosphate alpha-N-acetylglucosaminyl 1-phosphate transferase [Polaribacter vadi]|uniref:glycosyltransferase family 4 protein n=1 Tax=Polaribacter TaxID=52959 RepID=UPI001C093D4F|nr:MULTISPECIES: MraY family glycosyltransferase [Polaribacter]MBU3010515.1 undecaprenyl/decaprenyl-phosphate alpha-N-acetylglucosaminyl 1-phosphate transferase [Polaribacter vadi]MDO6740323.1 MraY family glycosyltransferase [Polaribacter sp. 1_MG-2023]